MRRVLPPALLSLALLGPSGLEPPQAQAAALAPEATGTISGVVRDGAGHKAAGALVILHCDGLAETRETKTNAKGLYRFVDVPASRCTVQVLIGQADVSKMATMVAGAKLRLNFKVDPSSSFKRTIRVKAQPVEQKTSVGRTVSMEEFRNIPVGSSTSRDFTQVVESSATASRDSAGIRLSGTTGNGVAGIRGQDEPGNREGYAHIDESPFIAPLDRPLSTFSADVDTASYSNVRRFINGGQLPPPDAVRIEELVNYFDYGYVTPKKDRPVTVNWEIATCPWNEDHLLARIGLQTRPIATERVPARNLVFLLDVSGSMAMPDKLPLLQRGMQLLVQDLRPEDHVSIVVYAGAAGVVLPPTSGKDRTAIRDAINALEPGGSTNGAGGIRLAYQLARESFMKKGINRVILATDGDFNVGTTSDGELVRLIEKERRSGVFLTVLGFGQGNLQDAKMEQLADHGNGNYAYIDDLQEARKVLVEEAGATLVTVAKDVKLQVEFNPAKISGYRLVGYENRLLADADFDDDTKDAGELGAGHSVTALYELVPSDAEPPAGLRNRRGKSLRYQRDRALTREAVGHEWMTVAVRYKPPRGSRSKRMEVTMKGRPNSLRTASDDLRFAAAVAMYGMELRGSEHRGSTTLRRIRRLANGAKGADLSGYRTAFVDLVDATARLRDQRD